MPKASFERDRDVGVVTLAVIAAVVLMGQATATKVAKVVEAEEFVLRDDSGTVRSRLEVRDDTVSLTFLDENGEKRLSLGVESNSSPWVKLLAKHGSIRLDVDDHGSPRLALFGAGVMALTLKQGFPVMFTSDLEGYPKFVLISREKGARLQLITRKTVPIADFGFGLPPPPQGQRFDSALGRGLERRTGSVLSATSSGLSLSDQWGINRAKFSLSDEGSPEVKLFNFEEGVIWSAP